MKCSVYICSPYSALSMSMNQRIRICEKPVMETKENMAIRNTSIHTDIFFFHRVVQ